MPLPIHITGHSMGGALGMLAALEIAQLRRCRNYPLKPREGEGVSTCTFAAPRIGDVGFAELFTKTFPSEQDHWALQVDTDAVPHLPFAAWGFRHPRGIAVLGEPADEEPADEVPADEVEGGLTRGTMSRGVGGDDGVEGASVETSSAMDEGQLLSARLDDLGETVHDVRPKNLDVVNWATMHDLSEYVRRLEALQGPGARLEAQQGPGSTSEEQQGSGGTLGEKESVVHGDGDGSVSDGGKAPGGAYWGI